MKRYYCIKCFLKLFPGALADIYSATKKQLWIHLILVIISATFGNFAIQQTKTDEMVIAEWQYVIMIAAFWVFFVAMIFPAVSAISFAMSRQLLVSVKVALEWYERELRMHLNGKDTNRGIRCVGYNFRLGML